jgi:hypothetical protein
LKDRIERKEREGSAIKWDCSSVVLSCLVVQKCPLLLMLLLLLFCSLDPIADKDKISEGAWGMKWT